MRGGEASQPLYPSPIPAPYISADSALRADERLWCDPAEPQHVRLSIGVSPRLAGGRTRYLGEHRASSSAVRRDPALIRALRLAHLRAAALLNTAAPPPPVTSRYERNLLRLACLAPDIQRDILQGRQPEALTLQQLVVGDLPTEWAAQRRALGF